MARDLNQLMEAVRGQRDVFVTPEGDIEDATEAAENSAREERTEGEPKRRTRLKPEVFGA